MSWNWKSTIGLFAIPVSFSLAQFWASNRIITQFTSVPQPHVITDGVLYIHQSSQFQDFGSWIRNSFSYGLYQGFLSLMHVPNLGPAWDASDRRILAVYAMQSLLLAAATAVFLFCVFRFSTGAILKRICVSALLGIFLLSPLVITWPANVLMESLTLTALLLLLSACIAFDARPKHSHGVALCLTAILLILVRDPLIVFVSLFAGLLALNLWFSRSLGDKRALIGIAALLAVATFGAARTIVISHTGKYNMPLANIVQVRILPNPQFRAFFAAHGLPVSPTITMLAGKPAWYKNLFVLPDSELSPEYLAYRNWLESRGVKTYAEFLLSHPGYVARSIAVSPNIDPDDNLGFGSHFSMLDLFSLPTAGYQGALAPYPLRVRDFLAAPLGWIISLAFCAYLLSGYFIRTLRGQRASSLEIFALVAFVATFASYHADADDPVRHCVPFLVAIYVAFVFRVPNIIGSLSRYTVLAAASESALLAADKEPIVERSV